MEELADRVAADHGFRFAITWIVDLLKTIPSMAFVVTAPRLDPARVAAMCDEIDAALREPEPPPAVVALFDFMNRAAGGCAEEAPAVVRAIAGKEPMSEGIRRRVGTWADFGHAISATSARAGA
jgi:hypothetical protein